MWLLQTPTDEFKYLKPNIPLTIGRKKGDIILSHDLSISRSHASFLVTTETKILNNKYTTSCILKDEESKYGTYILKNDEFEKISTYVQLKDEDVIRIGLQTEIFIVKYIPIITLTSGLEEKEKDKLQEVMKQIDGIILTDWQQNCTHLTVLNPKLTEKLAVALANGIIIVTINYWEAVKSAVENNEYPFPKIDNYIPTINEQYINKRIVSLYPNNQRKTLFKKFIFNFFDLNLLEKYKLMIKLAGGKSILVDLKNEKHFRLEESYIYVHDCNDYDENSLSRDFKELYDKMCHILSDTKQRLIPDSEIPLAILYCSIERFCNKKYQFSNVLIRQEKPDYYVHDTLVMDTQDQELVKEEAILPTQMSWYTKYEEGIKKSSKFVANVGRHIKVPLSEKSDNEEVSNISVQPTTSKSSFLQKSIISEKSDLRQAEVVKILPIEEQNRKRNKEKGSLLVERQQKPEITRNLSTINLSKQQRSCNMLNSSIRRHPIGKQFQKAKVKIPEKRIKL